MYGKQSVRECPFSFPYPVYMIGEELRFRLEAVRSWPSESSSPRPSGSAAGPATTRRAGRGSGLEESRAAAAQAPLRERLETGKRTTPSRCSTSRRAESRRSGRSRGWRSGSSGSRSPSSGGSYTGRSRGARRRSACILRSTPEGRKVDLAVTIMTRPSCLSCGVSLCWRVAGWTTYCKSVSGLKSVRKKQQQNNNAGKQPVINQTTFSLLAFSAETYQTYKELVFALPGINNAGDFQTLCSCVRIVYFQKSRSRSPLLLVFNP